MKYIRTILSAVFLCILTTVYAQTNVLRIPEVTYPAGKTLSLPIELENASDIVGVQFDLSVPYELGLDTTGHVAVTLSKNRITNHKVSCQKKGTTWRDANEHGGINTYHNYRFIVYSEDNTKISGSTGTLLSVELPLPEDLANGTAFPIYFLDNSVILSNRNKENIVNTQQDGKVTIEVKSLSQRVISTSPGRSRTLETWQQVPAGPNVFIWKVRQQAAVSI